MGVQRPARLERRRQPQALDRRHRARQDRVCTDDLVGGGVGPALDQRDPGSGQREQARRRATSDARADHGDIKRGHGDETMAERESKWIRYLVLREGRIQCSPASADWVRRYANPEVRARIRRLISVCSVTVDRALPDAPSYRSAPFAIAAETPRRATASRPKRERARGSAAMPRFARKEKLSAAAAAC
jgi:hypothetical protein